MKRRAFNPTAEQRGWIEALSSHGVPEAEICLLIKYPETGAPIGLETLRKHFAEEIATGASKMKLLVGNSIVASILGWDGGLTDEPTQARLAILFAKTRMGWNEVTSGETARVTALGYYGKLSIETPMDRTELWIVFAPAPGPMGTGAGSTMHNYSACRNFIKSS